jgi:hypothetical protein
MDEMEKSMIAVITGLLSLSWSIYMLWLLYNLVGATPLMWFMFWTYIPMVIIFTIIGSFVRRT